ncbi:hypothetical protein Q5424_22665 [Conexibacter sp. JD483]|nr:MULTISPECIES: hypothetical protein [unclassified Conexibacter]MDO8188448.1 hypothetical protein [Conexibacter sp. CPCC 205706]MDO8199191.1 hypothetical protein [Conexibacter sp. CPCC 205762]MDR9371918.1 hypothetical protein [Conexibacter sp. JD483]
MKLFANALLNALTPFKPAPYHLHANETGTYVCENPHCSSPAAFYRHDGE